MLTRGQEPAHSQMAANRTAYILLRLLKDGAMKESEALLSFSHDLVELATEQGITAISENNLIQANTEVISQRKVLKVLPME